MGKLYITHYCYPGTDPWKNIMNLPEDEAFRLAGELAKEHPETTSFYRFADFSNYYPKRKTAEAFVRERFTELGGKPELEHPFCFVLGESEYLEKWFSDGEKLTIALDVIPDEQISFTLGDSCAQVFKGQEPVVLTKAELLAGISECGSVEEFCERNLGGFGYVEVQVWKKPQYKYCLLDLDGTLTDPGMGITNSVMYALRKFGIEVTDRSELYCFIGPPLADSFQKYYGFDEEKADQAVAYYREYFRDKGIFENEVYPEIPEVLRTLKESGAIVALATSKPYEFAVRILEHFGLIQYFDYFGAATMDGRISKKTDVIAHLIEDLGDVDRSEVLMVGDRDQDINGAKANRLHSVGVLWGYGSSEELEGAGADFVLEGPKNLAGLFAKN